MQNTLQASILTTRATQAITTRILRNPETVRDIAECLEKEVSTSAKASAKDPLHKPTNINAPPVASTESLQTPVVHSRAQRMRRRDRARMYSVLSGNSSLLSSSNCHIFHVRHCIGPLTILRDASSSSATALTLQCNESPNGQSDLTVITRMNQLYCEDR